MKITFLGTAAACPLPFCRCNLCRAARRKGGKDLRKRSSLLINGDLLVDLGPDVMSASFAHGVDTGSIERLLQTHSHSDHFDAGHLITRIAEYAGQEQKRLHLYASGECIGHMSEKLGLKEGGATLADEGWRERLAMEVTAVKPGEHACFGTYEVIAIPSAHDVRDGSLMYGIRGRGTALSFMRWIPRC